MPAVTASWSNAVPVKTLAIVLLVKNEARDLPAWLAWHAAMGCDAFIIYDDHSHDGTWGIINQASRHLDIRAVRTDLAVSPFTERQKLSYLHALTRYGTEFEWMAFIDADEFLSTENNESLPDFLGSFSDAHAVAVNWCNYGSNGHALHPTIPVVEAFTRHSPSTLPINRHVKSIVRCAKFRSKVWNVHYFDVDDDYYVDSIGRKIEWWPTRGIGANAPDWFAAKVMHFQCRSMEHFVDRLKLRPDVPATTEKWREYDRNDVEDVHFRPLLGTFHRHYAAIGREIDVATFRILKHRLKAPGAGPDGLAGPATGSTVRAQAHSAFLIRTLHDTYLSCGDGDHMVRHRPIAKIDGDRTRPVILALHPELPGVGIASLPRDGTWLNNETRRGTLLAYEIDRLGPDEVALAVPHTRMFMCALPVDDGQGAGEITVDRAHVAEWERLTLVALDTTPFASSAPPPLPPLPTAIGDAAHLLDWIRATAPEAAAPVFNMLVQALSRQDRQAIEAGHGVILRN